MNSLKKFLREILSPTVLVDTSVNLKTKNILLEYVMLNSDWLDVGCGLQPFRENFFNANYIGIDVEVSGRCSNLKTADIFFNGINLPFVDQKFDGLLCTQVLEHVEFLEVFLEECFRVLKKNGRFVVSVPFMYKEHEQPFDFRRFTSFGLVSELKKCGFEVLSLSKHPTGIECIATLLSVYVNNNLVGKNKFLHYFFTLTIIFPINYISKILSKVLPDNGDLFCALVVVCNKR